MQHLEHLARVLGMGMLDKEEVLGLCRHDEGSGWSGYRFATLLRILRGNIYLLEGQKTFCFKGFEYNIL